jgi:peptidoglycan hydrolase-like protein with peptidoglycan-binding domain
MNQMNQGTQQTSQSQIEQAQQLLKSAGLYHGAVDGVVGPETQTAVIAFQREQGLPQTAQFDQQTLSRLGGSNTGAQQQNMTPSYPTGSQNPSLQNSTGSMNGTNNR